MFKEKLERIIERTPGGIGALIMGTDGIAVEQVLPPAAQDVDLDAASAEFTSLVRSAQQIARNTNFGELRELAVSLEKAYIIMRLISNEYFLVLALTAESNLGRGRYRLRTAELELASEFAV